MKRRLLGAPEDGWFFAAIADQVIEQRHARNLSQQELAELCGTTQSAIARFERGGRPPRVDTLLRMAEALDCELVVEFRPRTKTKGAKASLAMPPSGRAGSPARPSEMTGRTDRTSKTPKGTR
jgi:transcriptional regulator with XRE-family HTH domain